MGVLLRGGQVVDPGAGLAGAREVRELMDQQTLAGAGQAGEEETARLARQARQCHEQRRALAQEHAFG